MATAFERSVTSRDAASNGGIRCNMDQVVVWWQHPQPAVTDQASRKLGAVHNAQSPGVKRCYTSILPPLPRPLFHLPGSQRKQCPKEPSGNEPAPSCLPGRPFTTFTNINGKYMLLMYISGNFPIDFCEGWIMPLVKKRQSPGNLFFSQRRQKGPILWVETKELTLIPPGQGNTSKALREKQAFFRSDGPKSGSLQNLPFLKPLLGPSSRSFPFLSPLCCNLPGLCAG